MEEWLQLGKLIGEDKTPVHLWLFIEITDIIPTRLYYKPIGVDNGFRFFVVQVVAQGSEADTWHPTESEVEVMYMGTALFDGVRHLHLGSDQTSNYGYSHYPELDVHIRVFKELQNLQSKYCSDLLMKSTA